MSLTESALDMRDELVRLILVAGDRRIDRLLVGDLASESHV